MQCHWLFQTGICLLLIPIINQQKQGILFKVYNFYMALFITHIMSESYEFMSVDNIIINYDFTWQID